MSEPIISPELRAYLERDTPKWTQWARLIIPLPQRAVLAFMVFLGVVLAYCMRICLSLTIVAIVLPRRPLNSTHPDDMECPFPSDYASSLKERDEQYDWDQNLIGVVLSSFYFGYAITHIPGGLLSDLLGGKHVLTACISLTAIFTLISPLCIEEGGPYHLIAVRILMGLIQGTLFPAVNVLLASWIPVDERTMYSAIVYSSSQIGTVVGTALSGFLIEKYHSWSIVFYIFGFCGLGWAILFNLICSSDPQNHSFISDEEKDLLLNRIGAIHRTSRITGAPWMEMLKNKPLLVLVICQMGHDFGFFVLVTDLPKYLSDVLHYDIATNGYLTALPFIAMFVVSTITGFIADCVINREVVSLVNCRKVFAVLGALLPAVGLVLASYAGCDRKLVITAFTIGMACMGFYYSGTRVNGLDLSPRFAGTVMAFVNGAGAVMGIVGPIVVGMVTSHTSMQQYRLVFWIAFVLSNATCIPYIFYASGDIQPFDAHGSHLKPLPDVPEL